MVKYIDGRRDQKFDHAAEFYEDAAAQMLSKPCTLLHGDLKFSNYSGIIVLRMASLYSSTGDMRDLGKVSKTLCFFWLKAVRRRTSSS